MAVWQGDDAQKRELLAAIERNCTCQFDEISRARTATCASHTAMLNQEFLDRLLFNRSIRARLYEEEYLIDKEDK